jgi:nucleoside-diphosphate-sugar epimerase
MTGATGSLGFVFLAEVLHRYPRLKVVLLARTASSSFASPPFQALLAAHRPRITVVDGDLATMQLDEASRRQVIETDGGMWHFAASTKLRPGDPEVAREVHAINDAGTANLLEIMASSPHAGPLHYLSTAYVAGDRSGLVREDELEAGQGFRNDYEASKLRAEKRVHEAIAAGLRAVVYRPSIVMEDAMQSRTPKIADLCAHAFSMAIRRRQRFVFRFDEQAEVNLVHVDWVIAAMLDLAGRPEAIGRTYHLTAARESRFHEIASWVKHFVPHLEVAFEPKAEMADLPTGARIFDRAIDEIRSYLEANVRFDRTWSEQHLSHNLKQHSLDIPQLICARLRDQGFLSAERAA